MHITESIETIIQSLVASEHNHLDAPFAGETAWDAPLVGYCKGDDPYFAFLTEHIGDDYLTPMKAYRIVYPSDPCEAKELLVVSFVLPQTDKVRRDQRQATDIPAERWVHTRMEGHAFVRYLSAELADRLREMGYPSLCPPATEAFHIMDHSTHYRTSNWSERHTAYACHLGTFGLSRGLITPRGIAHRLGSIILKANVDLPRRELPHYMAHCLRTQGIDCRRCIDRCPSGAITEEGMDKEKCRNYQLEHVFPDVTARYGIHDPMGCGLCQCGVPCEAMQPKIKESKG